MLSIIMLMLSAHTVGAYLSRGFLREAKDPMIRHLVAMGVGIGCWYWVLFVLGHVGLLRARVIVPVAVATALPAIVFIAKRFPRLAQRSRQVLKLNVNNGLVALLLVFGVLTFLSAFSPVVGGIKNDAINYHLSVPKAWLLEGRIRELAYPISYLAGNSELLNAFVMSFGTAYAPKLLSWCFMILCVAMVFGMTRTWAGTRVGLLAAILAIINPLVFRTSFIAFIDFQAAFFALLVVWLIVDGACLESAGRMIVPAFLMGVGCGAKPTNYFYFLAIAVLLVLSLVRMKRPTAKARFARLIVFVSVVVGAGSAWPVRNLILTKSPTFPPPLVLYRLNGGKPFEFSGQQFTQADAREWFGNCHERTRAYGRGLGHFLVLPWNLTMHPGTFQIGDSIGTILLSLLPLVLLVGKRPRWVNELLLFFVLGMAAIYFLVYPEARFMLPALLAATPVLAWTAGQLSRDKRLRFAVVAVLGVNIAFSLAICFRLTMPKVLSVVSSEYRQRLRQENIPFVEAFDFLAAKPDAKVVVFYDHQIFYYLENDYIIRGDAEGFPPDFAGAYILDIDYSQVEERSQDKRGEYFLSIVPPNMALVFESADSRVYRLGKSKENATL